MIWWRALRVVLAVVLASFVLATAALTIVALQESPPLRALLEALLTG